MFIRHKPNKPKKIKPVIVQEVVPQEQPLEEQSIAEIALQKVEEVLTMVPEPEPEVIEEEPLMAEDVIEFINADEAPAEETIPDLLDDEEGE